MVEGSSLMRRPNKSPEEPETPTVCRIYNTWFSFHWELDYAQGATKTNSAQLQHRHEPFNQHMLGLIRNLHHDLTKLQRARNMGRLGTHWPVTPCGWGGKGHGLNMKVQYLKTQHHSFMLLIFVTTVVFPTDMLRLIINEHSWWIVNILWTVRNSFIT